MSRRSRRSESGRGVGFMRKHTFKSASASPRTFSRSGASARMAGTAGTTHKQSNGKGTYIGAVKKIVKMSPADFRRTLQRLGITKTNGELTVKYRNKK